MRKSLLLTTMLSVALMLGCGAKNKGADGAEDISDTDSSGTSAAEAGMEEEANTGPVTYPQAPAPGGSRNPYNFRVSIQKAYVLPLSPDGKCFDRCTKEVKSSLINGLPGLAGEQFGSAAKALTTAVGATGGKESLPDIYVNLNCVGGQEIRTYKTSQEDRLAASWSGVSDTIKLDVNDQCAISVWDSDEDGQDERIGDTTANLIALTRDGIATVSSEQKDFGQVYMVEFRLEQLDGPSVWGGASSNQGSGGSSGSYNSGGSSSSGSTGSGSSGGGSASSGKGNYVVEIVKANLQKEKTNGQKWDTKIPFVGKAEDEAPDPFVEAYVNGYQSEKPFLVTDAASNTYYTEWRRSGQVQLDPGDKIHFFIWDKDKVDHDKIAECISDPVGSVSSGNEIVFNNCGQAQFLVVKITRQ